MGRCVFCKILRNEAEASIVAESKHSIAFLDLHQINHGHTLVIPKVHYTHFENLPPDVLADMFQLAQKVYKGLQRSDLKCEAGNIFISNGDNAGQEVDHCHIHVVPRYLGDQKLMKFISANKIQKTPRTLLNDIAKSLRESII